MAWLAMERPYTDFCSENMQLYQNRQVAFYHNCGHHKQARQVAESLDKMSDPDLSGQSRV